MASDHKVTLKVPGREADQPALPRVLQARARSVGPTADDAFLPPGYVRPVASVDLSATARATDSGAIDKHLPAQPGQVIALELADGVTVFTSPQNLQRTLERVAPQAVQRGADGTTTLALDQLNQPIVTTRSTIGDAIGSLVTRVTTLDVGGVGDDILDAAKAKALDWLREKGEDKLADFAELGVSWLGTKALMWAIESRLSRAPGLYRWVGADGKPTDLAPLGNQSLDDDARQGPLLVFIHGTASSSTGSYADLQTVSRDYWRQFESHFGERVFAFEHRTLSESPIDNALQLARALPARARLNLVTHSRGGLVGDLMCLDKLDGADRALIDGYAVDEATLGITEGDERVRLRAELERAYAEQRAQLRELAATLRSKSFTIERYVRVAAPARGTRLASSNFDVFLSGLLALIGLVPALAGTPWYSAFKRVVLEVAKNRTKPNMVPGIEAMLPESPMARLLARAQPQANLAMVVIAGDIEGGGLLKRLGALFTDNVFFDGVDNDLVVDTDSMYAGVARPGSTRALFDRGPDVNHFRYFTNDDTRNALRRWLLEPNVEAIEAFVPLPDVTQEPSADEQRARDAARRRTRGGDMATPPVVVMLPGIMGSHLWVNRTDRVWFDFDDLVTGGLQKIRFDQPHVEAERLFDLFYGSLCEHLAGTHRVERFAYDWRQPIDALADALAARLRTLLDETKNPQRPVRLLAHSMGGLVVRALIHTHRPLWDELMQRDGARFVMLGTPNQGSHQMVETLLGKSDNIRNLARLDVTRDLQGVLDIVATFRGALQLLPRPGFADTGGEQKANYFDAALWSELKREMRDFWFGDGVAATPDKDSLDAGRWLWQRDGNAPALPAEHKAQIYYVHGCAANTPCGLRKVGERWKMLGTPRGDGSVTWDSGRIEGIGTRLYMPAEHGALADTDEYFGSLESLLTRGEPGQLMNAPPAVREVAQQPAIAYDAGPPTFPTALDLAASLVGRRLPVRARARPQATLKVRVRGMDLRGVTAPILVGHYEQDAISGAEALIDRELVDGGLTARYDLGLYAGALGTATVVLPERNEIERWRGSHRGAVVAGLGKYDGSLSVGGLTEAVRTAALRYLLQIVDAGGSELRAAADSGVRLATLLLGYNSSANLSIGDSVTALVRGVIEANRKFAAVNGGRKSGSGGATVLRIGELEIVELYRDTAISAAYAAQRVAVTLNADRALGSRIEVEAQLLQGDGVRERLEDSRANAYWSRMVITDADRDDDACPPECYTRHLEDCADDPCDCDEAKHGPDADAPGDGTAHLLPTPDRRLPAWARKRLAMAERLRFLYLGQARARAETLVQQRQPGLVEKLVANQLHVRAYQPDFSRTLFQLLVPHDFKDAARQLDRIVMVLDGYTANLPWELMLADQWPLAVQTAVVRQLSSTRFRQRVRTSTERRAYVVGNPSSKGFAAAFPRVQRDPDPLPAAENEAQTVVEVLTQYGYDVTTAIGDDKKAVDVVTALYKHPYRVLHIAAHGVFDEKHIDGKARSGVVLSDGLLITAAEIGAMEVVPDLVFLNCCHLGKVDRAPAAYNRLAYSVARELIEIGVRAVVVAGWAVDDDAASLFADTFYRGLLDERKELGDAAFAARRAAWQRYPGSITWGAYQVYGDPGWRLEPRRDDYGGGSGAASRWQPVAPDELIASIEQLRLQTARVEHALTPSETRDLARRIDGLLKQAPDPRWLKRLDVCACLGRFYGDLGRPYFGQAADYLRAAIEGRDDKWQAPVAALEQLASFEARDGEAKDDAKLIQRGIDRLLDFAVTVTGAARKQELAPASISRERAALLGGAYKRLAAVHARAHLRDGDAKAKARALAGMDKALEESERWYDGAKELDAQLPEPYNGLSWLFLVALTAKGKKEKAARITFAQTCASAAIARFIDEPNYWNAVMVPDAMLAESLLDGSLENADAARERVEHLASKYREATSGIRVKARELDSTVQQVCLLALFYAVRAKAGRKGASQVTEALRQLAERVSPGTCDGVFRGSAALP